MGLIPISVAYLEKKISHIHSLSFLYSRPYRRIIEKEIQLAEITAADRVLNIGCGAVPFTAFFIATQTGAEVWALDRDLNAVNSAKKYVERASLDNLIHLFHGDGRDPFSFEFDVALVALQVEPKKDIYHNLLSSVSERGRLVFRQPRLNLENHYDFLPKALKPSAEVKQRMQTFDRSSLFYKKGCAVHEA